MSKEVIMVNLWQGEGGAEIVKSLLDLDPLYSSDVSSTQYNTTSAGMCGVMYPQIYRLS